jgi:multidrug efflux system outer membrane protein
LCLTAQQQLATDSLSRQANLVTLYKVLGGGWENG